MTSHIATSNDDFRKASPELPIADLGESDDGRRETERRLGSKGGAGVWQTIINQMPPHRAYIEPFLGWAVVMKAKLPADRNIGIDRDADRIQSARLDLPTAELTIGDGGLAFLSALNGAAASWVYCDPPYLLETRSGSQRYSFQLSDHSRLLDVLLRLSCPVILSGYHSTLYAETLRTWRAVTFTGVTRGGPRTEYLWCNFPEPIELHDYRYLGRNFRERDNLKRMKHRWKQKLATMPPLKRHALFAALREALERSQSHARAFTVPTRVLD